MILRLTDVLERNGVPYRQSGPEITICCPFCVEQGYSPDTRFRLGINLRTGKGHCFNCEWKSRHAASYVAKRFHEGDIELEFEEPEEEPLKRIELPEDFQKLRRVKMLADYWERKALRYVKKRGMTQRQIRETGIGMSLTGKFAYRVIFPVRYDGMLTGLVARDFTGKRKPPYLNTSGTKAVWNLDRIGEGPIIVTEGIFKSLALERYMDKPATALLGRDITETQVQMLKDARKRAGRKIILWPDPGRPGVEGFLNTADRLTSLFKVFMPYPPPQKEADEMTREEIERFALLEYSEDVELQYKASLLA